MNTSDLVILSILFAFMLFFIQRTERKRIWLPIVLLLAPISYIIYRWAIYKGEVATTLVAALIGLALNLAYWLAYGRRHPPASSDEIKVIGSDQ